METLAARGSGGGLPRRDREPSTSTAAIVRPFPPGEQQEPGPPGRRRALSIPSEVHPCRAAAETKVARRVHDGKIPLRNIRNESNSNEPRASLFPPSEPRAR